MGRDNHSLTQIIAFTLSGILKRPARFQVLFRGDSHSRQLYAATTEDACPSAGAQASIHQTEMGMIVSCVNSSQCSRNLSGVCHFGDHLGPRTGVIYEPLKDLAIANFGLHGIVGMITFEDFRKKLDNLIGSAGGGWKGRFVWHDINAVAYRKDAWTLSKGQPQTNIKIAIFNAHATRRFKELGYPIIPAFAQTLALTQSTRDVAHYAYQVLQQSTMQFVLGLLCPSG